MPNDILPMLLAEIGTKLTEPEKVARVVVVPSEELADWAEKHPNVRAVLLPEVEGKGVLPNERI